MGDVLNQEARRRCMSAIHSKGTTPELAVRQTVYSLGYRYRLHIQALPGKPDLVFYGRKKLIFVHGCFWHRHTCKKGASLPQTNREFWQKKLSANVDRDKQNIEKLQRLGWDILVVWECETKFKNELQARLRQFLTEAE